MSESEPEANAVPAARVPEKDRRDPATPDRRTTRRGGRRATDLMRDVADFVYRLLSEPP